MEMEKGMGEEHQQPPMLFQLETLPGSALQ